MRPNGDFHDPPAVAVLDDIGLASRRTDPDTEALYLVIPEDMLTVPGLEGVDGSFGDLGHCTLRFSLPAGEPHGYPQDANRSVFSRRLPGRQDSNTMKYISYCVTCADMSRHPLMIADHREALAEVQGTRREGAAEITR